MQDSTGHSGVVVNMLFDFDQIKRTTMYMVESKALDHDGIIFGGAVRDEIISEEYAKRYRKYLRDNKERFDKKKFWDVKYHPETAARTLVPQDLDICFQQKSQSDTFLNALRLQCEEEYIQMDVENAADDASPPEHVHKYGRMVYVSKVKLTIVVGKIPFLHTGYKVAVQLDVVTPCYNSHIQPPFMNLDFLCNGFIKTRYGITYSKNTGTYIDNLSELERTKEILKIQEDMIMFKTNFCNFEKIKKRDVSTLNKNIYAYKRISKLLCKKTFTWTICNLPFNVVKATAQDCTTECCICCEPFKEDSDRVFYVPVTKDGVEITSENVHLDCIMTYFKKQHEDALDEHLCASDVFVFKCPIRTQIDFTKCSCTYKNSC